MHRGQSRITSEHKAVQLFPPEVLGGSPSSSPSVTSSAHLSAPFRAVQSLSFGLWRIVDVHGTTVADYIDRQAVAALGAVRLEGALRTWGLCLKHLTGLGDKGRCLGCLLGWMADPRSVAK